MLRTSLAIFVFIFCVVSFSAKAQAVLGNYQSGFKKQGNEIYFTTSNSEVRLQLCTSSTVRVRASWNKQFAPDEPWMVSNYTWAPLDFQASEEKNFFLIKTQKLKIKVNKSPFRIDFYTADGKLLSSEETTGKAGGLSQQDEAVTCRKQMLANEHFFGFGERMDFVDQRAKKLKLNVGRGGGMPHITGAYNILEANYSPVPFFMSTQGYGIFLHNAFPTEWDMGATTNDAYTFKANGGELDYYFMYGPSFPAILDQYTSITGKSPLLPEFALGLHVGTYSGGTWGFEQFTSDQYVIDLARKFRAMGVPADIFHLDSTWRIFGKNGGKGATSFEWRETFKNPKGMFDSLYAMHYKMVGLHLRPRFDNGKTLNLLDQARAKGFTYPEGNSPGEFVNFFDQKAVDWWWENGVMKVASQGAKFLKTDEGSAFGSRANESDKVGPTGKDAKWLHNVFPIAYAKAPYEKFQQYNNIRGMNHTREGYAGIQRYPFIFAGDWPSEWQYFAPVIKAGLNIGISGVSNWAHCMGGFEHAADPEFYVRWCQFGLLSPVAHIFGMDHPGYKEPWNYGEEALTIFRTYDRLRYRLIPYLYSNSYTAYKTGMPLMRALVLEYQDDENVYSIADQYLLGSSMMVCPVTEKGAQTRIVYLPQGTWYDYWTGEKYEGKRYLNVLTPLNKIPVFIKAGAIIPMQPEMNYLEEKPVDVITLDIFPNESSSFKLYEDDGKSLTYQQGNFAITEISSELSSNAIMLKIQKPKGIFIPSRHTYLAKIHWPSAAPKAIMENGKSAVGLNASGDVLKSSGWYYDATEKVIWVRTVNINTEDITIGVNF